MNGDFLSKAPPWLIVLALLGSGGGGVSLGSLMGNGKEKKLVEISQQILTIDRKLDSMGWRITAHTDRLNGNSAKNREQDKRLSDLKTRVVILDAMATIFPKEKKYE